MAMKPNISQQMDFFDVTVRRICSCLVTGAQQPWGVSAGGGFMAREAQRMCNGSGITYLYRCNSNCNNTVNLLWI